MAPLIAGAVLFGLGVAAGRAARPGLVPLVIERRTDSPLLAEQDGAGEPRPAGPSAINGSRNSGDSPPATVAEDVYICGARTRKGTPCSRRVHGPVRCWQHKGLPAMLPKEKLLVKD
jgi:hypothetical protein